MASHALSTAKVLEMLDDDHEADLEEPLKSLFVKAVMTILSLRMEKRQVVKGVMI